MSEDNLTRIGEKPKPWRVGLLVSPSRPKNQTPGPRPPDVVDVARRRIAGEVRFDMFGLWGFTYSNYIAY